MALKPRPRGLDSFFMASASRFETGFASVPRQSLWIDSSSGRELNGARFSRRENLLEQRPAVMVTVSAVTALAGTSGHLLLDGSESETNRRDCTPPCKYLKAISETARRVSGFLPVTSFNSLPSF